RRPRVELKRRDRQMPGQLRIVSIGAHPADTFDQSGGTMAHHADRGDFVAAVSITHGARVHDAAMDSMYHRREIPDAKALTQLIHERSDVKAEEVRTACGMLGVDEVHFLGIDAGIML